MMKPLHSLLRSFTLIALVASACSPTYAQFDPKKFVRDQAEKEAKNWVKKQLAKMLGAETPLLLNQQDTLELVPDSAVPDFKPHRISPTLRVNFLEPLPPGDYVCDVIAYCTQWSIHRPGQGIPYKIGRVKGKQAKAISALLIRGTLQGIAPSTLNASAWRIQAGIPLGKWSVSDRELTHRLIPEYEKEIEGDPLQKIEGEYESKYRRFVGISFDQLLSEFGELGNLVRSLQRARQTLMDESITNDNLPDRLYERTGEGGSPIIHPDNPTASPWMKVQAGVFAHFTVIAGNLGRNRLEFRIEPTAVNTTPKGQWISLSTISGGAPYLLAAHAAQKGKDATKPDPNQNPIQCYSQGTAAQAFICTLPPACAEIAKQIAEQQANGNLIEATGNDIIIYRGPDGGIAHSGVVRFYNSDGSVAWVESKWTAGGRYLHPPDSTPFGTSWTVWNTPRNSRLLVPKPSSDPVKRLVGSPDYWTDPVDGKPHSIDVRHYPASSELDGASKYPEICQTGEPTGDYNCHGFVFTNGAGYIKPFDQNGLKLIIRELQYRQVIIKGKYDPSLNGWVGGHEPVDFKTLYPR